MSPDATEYVYQNVGATSISDDDAVEYVYLNVGFDVVSSSDATEYVYFETMGSVPFTGWGVPL